MKGVTVIVCCYNSSSRIEETLIHLAAQVHSSDLKWEIIVVDNASSDDTSDKATNVWQNLHRPDVAFKVIHQPIRGLANARQKGIATAQYDVVIFCDDDNRLGKNYLESAIEILSDPTIDVVCGYGIAISQATFPKWFDQVFTFYACHSIDGNRDLSKRPEELQYGAGMVLRKPLLDHIEASGYSYYLTDRYGSQLSSGQDTELILLAKILGKKVVTSDKLIFHHYIPESRLSKNYLYKLIEGVCFGGFKLEPFKVYLQNAKPMTNVTWLKDTLYVAKYFLRAASQYLLQGSFQNKVYLLMNWHALQCSLSNYNQYKVIGKRLDNLKVTVGENTSMVKHFPR